MAQRSIARLLTTLRALEDEDGGNNGSSLRDIVSYMRKNMSATGDVRSQLNTSLRSAVRHGLVEELPSQRFRLFRPLAEYTEDRTSERRRSRSSSDSRDSRSRSCSESNGSGSSGSRTSFSTRSSVYTMPRRKQKRQRIEHQVCCCHTQKGRFIACNRNLDHRTHYGGEMPSTSESKDVTYESDDEDGDMESNDETEEYMSADNCREREEESKDCKAENPGNQDSDDKESASKTDDAAAQAKDEERNEERYDFYI
ncbi:general transcription factor IIF subunit 1-like [Periplaneta americana]|uniref:general transcription factor IIF subunit 1-like n=1 Tax=Periplaneta americana TaxID=6978 RepID=UPI0037E7B8B4